MDFWVLVTGISGPRYNDFGASLRVFQVSLRGVTGISVPRYGDSLRRFRGLVTGISGGVVTGISEPRYGDFGVFVTGISRPRYQDFGAYGDFGASLRGFWGLVTGISGAS